MTSYLRSYRERTPRRALKIALIDAELSQKELARVLRIEKSTISRIVNGEYRGTHRQQLAIARLLRRSVHELFPDHPVAGMAS